MKIFNQSIYVGTSGWNYDHWQGPFYPQSLKKKEWLDYYQKHFSTVEINNSFYQLPHKETFTNWKNSVKTEFLFSVKASRYITHMKKLKQPKESLHNFTDNVIALEEKLGPLLFQLPPGWKSNAERLKNFLQLCPDNLWYTFEFRDPHWWNKDIYNVLEFHNAAFCIFELGETQSPLEITSELVYIRLHGPDAAYEGKYRHKTLKSWAEKIQKWSDQGKTVFLYFDNDQKGFAAENALELCELLNID